MKAVEKYSLIDRVALVTGGGSGIGQATALSMAEAGARVALVDMEAEKLGHTAKKLQAKGGVFLSLQADVGQPEQMENVYRDVENEWGRLDIVFANAGINGVWAPLESLTPQEWDKTLRVNLTGTFLTVKFALPLLKKRGGSIIITSSINGTRIFSNTGATAYSCSKAAEVAFAKMVAVELAPFRIRVNAICPGAIATGLGDNTSERDREGAGWPVEFPKGQVPLTGGDPGSSEQVARLVHFLASDAADHITGTEMWIDGGQSLVMG